MEKVAIYNRCSTEEENQVNALAIQVQESREIAEKKNWKVIEQYVESQSGTSVYKRREYLRMVQDIEVGKFDIVMIKSIDRLARNVKDWYLFLDCVTRNHTQLYLYLDNTFYKSDDALITGIKAILAEEFSKELSKKIKNAHRRRQEKRTGLNISRAMFGWDKVGKDIFVVNEEEAMYFRRACSLVEKGYGFRRIAERMYEEGARQKDGKMLSAVQWRNMLRSERAHGSVILHKREFDFETKQYKKLPPEEWITMEKALPPLISPEYHKKILAILDKRTLKSTPSEHRKTPMNAGKHMLSGKIYCKECGKKYYYSQNTWKCSTYLKEGRKKAQGRGCNNRNISQKEMESFLLQGGEACYKEENSREIQEQIVEILKKFFFNLDCSNANHKRLGQLEMKLQKQKQKQELLLQKLLEGIIENQEYVIFSERMKEEAQGLEEKIAVIKQQNQQYTSNSVRWKEIEKVIKEEKLLEKAAVRVYAGLVKEIYIDKSEKPTLLFDKNL